MSKKIAINLLFVLVICILLFLGYRTPNVELHKVSTPSAVEFSPSKAGEEKNPIQTNLGNEKEDMESLMHLRSHVQEPPSPRN